MFCIKTVASNERRPGADRQGQAETTSQDVLQYGIHGEESESARRRSAFLLRFRAATSVTGLPGDSDRVQEAKRLQPVGTSAERLKRRT